MGALPGPPVDGLGMPDGPQAAEGIDEATSVAELAPLIPSFELMANLPSASHEFRAWLRSLKSKLAGD